MLKITINKIIRVILPSQHLIDIKPHLDSVVTVLVYRIMISFCLVCANLRAKQQKSNGGKPLKVSVRINRPTINQQTLQKWIFC